MIIPKAVRSPYLQPKFKHVCELSGWFIGSCLGLNHHYTTLMILLIIYRHLLKKPFKLLFLGGRAIVTEGDKYVVKGKRGRPSKIKHSLQISSTFEQVNKDKITFSSPPKIS